MRLKKIFLEKLICPIVGALQRIVRRSTSWAWQREIQACDGMAELKAMNMDGNKMDIKIQTNPDLAYWQAKCFAFMVAQSPNYTEMKFELCGEYKGKYEWMTVLIKKDSGKTPHELRMEAERERDELRRSLTP